MNVDSQNAVTLQQENRQLREEVAALRQDSTMYRGLFAHVSFGVYIYHLEDMHDDRTLRMVAANPAVEALTGVPPEAIVGKTLDENFPGLREQGVPQAFAEVVRSGEPFEMENIYGDEHVIESAFAFRAVALPDQCVAVMFENITQRKQAEQQMAAYTEELQIFKTLVESVPDGIGIASLDTGRLTYANPAYRAMYGYGDATIGMSFSDLSAESPQHQAQMVQEAITHGSWSGEINGRHKDGSIFPMAMSGTVLHNTDGQPFAVTGIIRDLTDQKQRQANLEMFKAVIDAAPDGMAFANLDTGRIIYANSSYRTMYGYDDQIIGLPFTDAYTESPERMREIIQEATEQGLWSGELGSKRADGSTFPVFLSGLVLRDETGKPSVAAGILRDMTEQKQAEAERAALQQQIIEAQRDALRELSTPLIPISDHVVIMPLIGTIDSGRAQQIMEALLEGVAHYQADLVILDITGVRVVDTQVAQSFIQAAQAVRLLGAQVMLTGIQPQIAQTLVQLGVDLGSIITHGSLQTGIMAALQT